MLGFHPNVLQTLSEFPNSQQRKTQISVFLRKPFILYSVEVAFPILYLSLVTL
uniref:Uncharacterized protein n=1 Tax=Anguilla anguilla TaxID=7936 RepID=A0A0E9UX94_ANGAN